MAILAALTLYAREPAKLAAFWSKVLDLPIDPGDEAAIAAGALAPGEAVLLGPRDDFHLWISPADEMPPAHGRIHFEVQLGAHTDSELLRQLGATREWTEPAGGWIVYADPEGNRFCAIPASPQPAVSQEPCDAAMRGAADLDDQEPSVAGAGKDEHPCTR